MYIHADVRGREIDIHIPIGVTDDGPFLEVGAIPGRPAVESEFLFMAEKDNSPDMSLMDGAVDDIADVLLKSKMSSQRIAVVRQRRINRMFYFYSSSTAISKVFGEVYNSRGKLNDMYRRKAVNSLHITESIPEHITQLDFISLIPNELRTDQRIVIDLVKRLSEAARHRQRIARANFIYRNEAQRLSEIFRECIHREDQCVRLAKLISDVRSERQWKGSMPSVEWFLRRKRVLFRRKLKKWQAAGPAAPNKLKRLLEISKTSNGDEERLKIPKTTDFALNDKQDLEAKIEAETPTGTPTAMGSPNGVSTTIISTEELHFPSSSNSESGMLIGEHYSDQIRHYMLRLRQAANRRLAEQAVDLISTLSSEECAQFLSDIDSDGVAGLN
ncbi:hypothetical protein DINM_001035 [Dirofilaria immitis]|nr:hypothetical protein [Dirofilaria immitis]